MDTISLSSVERCWSLYWPAFIRSFSLYLRQRLIVGNICSQIIVGRLAVAVNGTSVCYVQTVHVEILEHRHTVLRWL